MTVNPAGSRHETRDMADRIGVIRPPQDMNILPTSVWPRTASRDKDGMLTIGGVRIDTIIEQYGTPVFVVDEEDFRSRCRDMAGAFGGAENVHYATKAFLSQEIVRWVHNEGLHMDVSSGWEMAVARSAGMPAEHMVLHGNNKSVDELRYAVSEGVGHVVLDSGYEIDRLEAIAAEAGVVQDVFIRVTCGVEAHTHDFIATAHEDQKFGFSLAAGKAAEAVAHVLRQPHLRLTGLHSHIGSQIFDVDGFEVAAHRIIEFYAQLAETHGREILDDLTLIDLGGGFGIAYLESDDPPVIASLAKEMRDIVQKAADQHSIPAPRLLVEPGRSIVGPTMATFYRVGTLKEVDLPQGIVRHYVSVDGGMSDNIRTALYDAEYDCRLVNRTTTADPMLCRIVGKHCESGDVVVRDTWQPADLQEDDILGVAATGAYCYAMASRYNMLTRSPVVAVRNGEARLILRRETLDDLLSLEVS